MTEATPATTRYLASRCPACGTPKTRPAATAYVYCDACGALADYDFRKACEQPMQMPGPVYRNLQERLAPKLAKAQAAGDREAFRDIQLQLFDAWVTACPNSVPVRVGDPDYRRAYVAHLAHAATFAAFDAEAARIGEAMNHAIAALQWTTSARGTAQVESASFERLYQAVHASLSYLVSDAVLSQLPPHPDEAPAPLQLRMSQAMFVQGWLPYLDEASAQRLLERTGLTQEYRSAESAPTGLAHCGHCKAEVVAVEGARRAVCEACGHRLLMDRRIDCSGCGADLRLDGGGQPVNCPYCQARIERIAIPWPTADTPA
ncbi:hypothetical protein [Arenimonas sp.]|uniref:hypothetical protein n=1 Tax=Arenimonas sp. TaxID=1872635 RepID=UPI0039E63784